MRLHIHSFALRIIFVSVALLLVLLSLLYFTRLSRQMAEEEAERMELWAEATRQVIMAEPDADVTFASGVIERNTTIPVYMTDGEGQYLFSRNVSIPKRVQAQGEEAERAYLQSRVDHLRRTEVPIEVHVAKGVVQYIYHEDSHLLRQITYFPYVAYGLTALFFLVVFLMVITAQNAEQNRVWAGLSKETAHQLGTPVSSLNAWREILAADYPDNEMIQEMDKDIRRLTIITERFSKVGSRPDIASTNLVPLLEEVVSYMQTRTSSQVRYTTVLPDEAYAQASKTLLMWVVENLLRNAVDAMDGVGQIELKLTSESVVRLTGTTEYWCLDVRDTGKGIARRDRRRIFQPGYTTKERGWGMGLSLCKRIVEDFHHGRITLLQTSPSGTTFRISLPR